MNSTIIECSRFDASDITSNATWKNNLPNGGITVNAGDQISIKNCFINTQTSDSENISIPETINLQFTVGYYDVNYNTPIDANEVDYDYYIAYNNSVGTVATLQSLQFSLLYSSQPIENFLSCEVQFSDSNGKFYDLIWGTYDDKKSNQPDVPIPRPTTGDHSEVEVIFSNPVYNDIVVSSLKVFLDKDDYFSGATWLGEGQGDEALNTGFVSVKIDAGEYTRAGLAKTITDALQTSPPNFRTNYDEIGNDMMRRTDQSFNHLGFLDDVADTPIKETQIVLANPFTTINSVQDTGIDYDLVVSLRYSIYDPFNNILMEVIEETATIESLANNGIQIINGNQCLLTFTGEIFPPLTDYRYGTVIVTLPNENVVFRRVGEVPTAPLTKSYTYTVPTFYGSSENVLEYDEDRSVFIWQYLHMPYYTDNPKAIGIKQLRNTNVNNLEAYNKYYTVTALGGVFFLNIEPMSFMEQLGFTSDQLIVPIQNDGSILRDDLIARITYGYSSLSSLLDLNNQTSVKIINTNVDQDVQTTDTIGIYASSIDDLTSGGFYLVSVDFGNQNYLFQNGLKNNIQAIVGKYNQIRDFITGYSDSSINYIHYGIPFNLQTISVNILDPESKLPDTTVGDKSTIFIEITKGGEQLALPEPKK